MHLFTFVDDAIRYLSIVFNHYRQLHPLHCTCPWYCATLASGRLSNCWRLVGPWTVAPHLFRHAEGRALAAVGPWLADAADAAEEACFESVRQVTTWAPPPPPAEDEVRIV